MTFAPRMTPIGGRDVHLATHLFRPDRLALARELRGFTKVELAELVGKTPSALSQFESGRIKPDPQTTTALADVLQVPLGFFAHTSVTQPLSTDSAFFRSLRSTSQKDRRRLLARGTLICDLVRLLEDQVDFPSVQVQLADMTTRSGDDIERCALDVRAALGLGLGPIPSIIALLESKGVLITRVPSSCSEVDAFSVRSNYRPIVFLVTEKRSASRTRFDAAHELGHLVMHADVATANPDTEREANRFAGAFLVPRESFLRECPRYLNWDHFYELKRRWLMSVAALVRRAFDLGLLSEASYRRAFMQLNQRGERLQEHDEPPVEQPTLLRQAVALLGEDMPLEALCSHLGINRALLEELVDDGTAYPTTRQP